MRSIHQSANIIKSMQFMPSSRNHIQVHPGVRRSEIPKFLDGNFMQFACLVVLAGSSKEECT